MNQNTWKSVGAILWNTTDMGTRKNNGEDRMKGNNSPKKIIKPSIILTSAGRTGTKFFANLFKVFIDDIDSLHVPEETPKLTSFPEWKKQMQYFGLYNITINRLTGNFGMRFLSNKASSGKLEPQNVKQSLYAQRYNFVNKLEHKYYAESNPGLYGLIPYFNDIWEDARIIFVVRSGPDWVRSHMNWGAWYGKNDLTDKFGWRLSPKYLRDDPHKSKWDTYNRFQKLCWAWYKINSIALENVNRVSNAAWFKFEALFPYNKLTFDKFIRCATSHISDDKVHINEVETLFRTKVNKNIDETFPKWESWPESYKVFFWDTCGTLMHNLGYNL